VPTSNPNNSVFNKWFNYALFILFVAGVTGLLLMQRNLLSGMSHDNNRLLNELHKKDQFQLAALSRQIADAGRKTSLYDNLTVLFICICVGVLMIFLKKYIDHQQSLINQLEVSRKTACDALSIKENFLANMSHEIRTPLNSILGFTNLLKRQNHKEESAEFIDSIQKSGENLLTIINDILDLSKIEAGMMRIVKNPFSINGLLQSIGTMFNESAKEKRLELLISIDPSIPDTLIGDATRLTQILVNLIGNALKFCERGQIEVKVFTRYTDKAAIHVGFKVADTGIGIEKEKLASIFERFNQAKDSITRTYGGTGLGLTIVKNLVLLQGGEIEVTSEIQKGTEFYFFIPYVVPENQPTLFIQPNRAEIKELIRHDLNVLVVDDNVMNQSLMKHLLLQWDISFVIVSNGQEAIKELERNNYHLVLMDIQMPVMDGYSATQHIRSVLKLDIPIIAMTAHAMAGEREKCLANGLNEYISKPVDEQDLFNLITRFVQVNLDQEIISIHTDNPPVFEFIDLSYMLSISRGNKIYEKTVTLQFIEIVTNNLTLLTGAFERKNYTEINRIAHDMKTSVAIMGLLPRLNNKLSFLEYADSYSIGVLLIIDDLKYVCIKAIMEAKTFANAK